MWSQRIGCAVRHGRCDGCLLDHRRDHGAGHSPGSQFQQGRRIGGVTALIGFDLGDDGFVPQPRIEQSEDIGIRKRFSAKRRRHCQRARYQDCPELHIAPPGANHVCNRETNERDREVSSVRSLILLNALTHYVHFFDQCLCTIDLVHHPQHVTGIDMDRARGARIEIPVRIDAFEGPVEQQAHEFGT